MKMTTKKKFFVGKDSSERVETVREGVEGLKKDNCRKNDTSMTPLMAGAQISLPSNTMEQNKGIK